MNCKGRHGSRPFLFSGKSKGPGETPRPLPIIIFRSKTVLVKDVFYFSGNLICNSSSVSKTCYLRRIDCEISPLTLICQVRFPQERIQLTISATSTIENKSKSLFIEQPEKKFTKISKDLHKLMMTGCSKCTAAAYQTYSFCISMHPDSVITPAKIAASLNTIAEKNGGKALSERTIRRHLAMLEKVDLVEREYLKDKEGKFLGGIWRFFSLNSNGHKWPMDDSDDLEDNQTISKEKIEENPEKPIGQKGPPVYNKERVRVCKTKSERCSSSAATFSPQIENARMNGPKISKKLIIEALNFGEDYTLEAIKYAREKNPVNPGCVFRGAALERYDSIDTRLKNRDTVIAKNSNSNNALQEKTGKKVIYRDKEYTIGECGELITEFGNYNKYQVDNAIEKGIMTLI